MELPVTIFTVASNVFLGLLTYFKNPRSATNILFALLSTILGAWAVSNYFSLHAADLPSTLAWIRIVLSIVTPMWTVLFLLVLVFPGDELKVNKVLFGFLILYTILTSGVALSPYMFTSITGTLANPQPVPGPGIALHAVLAIGSLIACSFVLIRRFRKAQGRLRSQLKFFLFGIVISFSLLILTNFVLVNVFQNTSLVVFGPFFTLILVGSISYAIVRHRFLDIRLIVARTVAYVSLLTILAVVYSLGFFVIGDFIIGVTGRGQLVVSTALAMIIALSFQPLRNFIERLTDKIFFRYHYDSQEFLKNLSVFMSVTIDLKRLTGGILEKLLSEVRITRGAFILLVSHDHDMIEATDFRGYDRSPIITASEIAQFLSQKNMFVFDELPEGLPKEIMRKLNISLVLPLIVNDEKVGVLFLGEKQSGDIYSQKDIKVLEILVPELSVAIKHSKEYEEIKKFNITLREEVNKATGELKEANVKLQELDLLKDDFVSIASHELRTPMTAIRSYAWMALHKADIPLSDKVEKYIIRVLLSTERLINLVNDMLNISRIESGRIEINPESVDLVSLVKDIVDEVYYSKSTERNLHFMILEKKIPKAFADPDKLRQVLLNLVGNSLKFTPIDGKITFDFFTDGKVVEVSVKDSGVGISKEDQSKLFHKFSRLDSSYTAISTSGGTGLGLFISKSLIELMHGKIWASSEGIGKGTTMTISLPVASPDIIAHPENYIVKAKGEVKGLEPVAI
ncbi:hypothetical protein A3J13_01565 [Candidatus Daviesbacteria bacterium RIFCSPLOWO2_02_FULL_36_8]|uniref:histidine kinase n=1 Tax=Candidatus Daviesbacteria bacterium RIFCSPLOWO2_02_FULL_36_8 TaxID=1797793 RepID=A0A1F5MGX6_9BACT|nr:MAG: hypothetical protein A3J13_01565 [Candidatus Daviesbacteria bacterium RIFCSPLOWO2_02_FULL_36_8]